MTSTSRRLQSSQQEARPTAPPTRRRPSIAALPAKKLPAHAALTRRPWRRGCRVEMEARIARTRCRDLPRRAARSSAPVGERAPRPDAGARGQRRSSAPCRSTRKPSVLQLASTRNVLRCAILRSRTLGRRASAPRQCRAVIARRHAERGRRRAVPPATDRAASTSRRDSRLGDARAADARCRPNASASRGDTPCTIRCSGRSPARAGTAARSRAACAPCRLQRAALGHQRVARLVLHLHARESARLRISAISLSERPAVGQVEDLVAAPASCAMHSMMPCTRSSI